MSAARHQQAGKQKNDPVNVKTISHICIRCLAIDKKGIGEESPSVVPGAGERERQPNNNIQLISNRISSGGGGGDPDSRAPT